MILSKRVALGGVQLDELHDAIVIRSIDPGVPKESISAVSRMGGWGQRMTGQHWDTLEVSVTYAIDIPKREMILRRQVFEAVTALPLPYREVVLLHYYAGYTTREIGRLLRRKPSTVQTQLQRARAILKEQLKEVWEE